MKLNLSVPSHLLAWFAIVWISPALSIGKVAAQAKSRAGLGVTAPEQFSVPDGFAVDLLYEVPADTQGSWVSLTVDPKGRLIACDQLGGLFRIDVSGPEAKVEKLSIDLAGAQGLLCAFGSLYANVNSRGEPCGLWRLTDTNGDDQYDKKEHIVPLNGGSEHGPHAVILTPDQKRIMMVAGNNTELPKQIDRSRVPRVWDEDHLLGRMPDARGHNASRLAPGGFVMAMEPDGSQLELIATGFRNPYDIALNQQGELFAYDADMEWDVGTPWYRPTRVNHVISGSEFGWRNGTGKWPAYYPDSFGAAVDIGPGSPTGICFGYGSKFPKKYQDALFICDWSYGNIHAVTLTEDGASYSGSFETFATAAPLPVTDIVVHPDDGWMYFTIGGRKTQSALYRIRYTSQLEGTAQTPTEDSGAKQARQLRHQLESLHVADGELAISVADAIALAVANLGHSDRAIRFAARVALEHRGRQAIMAHALQDGSLSGEAKTLAVIAAARMGQSEDQPLATETLLSVDLESESPSAKIDWLRAAGLVMMRLGDFNADQRTQVLSKLEGQFPSGVDSLDRELAMMLIRLRADGATAAVVNRLVDSPSQESQIHYAMTLRAVTEGWDRPRKKQYLSWFNEIKSAKGGRSFGGFIDNIKKVVVEKLTPAEQSEFASVIQSKLSGDGESMLPARPFVKQWTVDELVGPVEAGMSNPNFERGKEMFAAAQCYKCHRMGLQGGILGPDLTSAGGKFSIRDMLTSIIEPSKVISDQYGSTQFLTEDGEVITGRVINMNGKNLMVMTNMLDPSATTNVDRDSVVETMESAVSMMPSGLLDTLTAEEIADLVAYLRAGGNAKHVLYKKTVAAK